MVTDRGGACALATRALDKITFALQHCSGCEHNMCGWHSNQPSAAAPLRVRSFRSVLGRYDRISEKSMVGFSPHQEPQPLAPHAAQSTLKHT